MDIDIDVDETIETLGGLILHHLGRLPEEGERLDFDAFDVRVEKVQGTHILKITVYPKSPQKAEIN